MAVYLVLWKFVQGGAGEDLESIKEAITSGAPSTRELMEQHGGRLREIYLAMGRYDGAAIVEFPDDVSCAQAMIGWSGFGVSTETLRVFPESDWSAIAEGV